MSTFSRRKIGRLILLIKDGEDLSVSDLASLLDCDKATIKRTVAMLRREYFAPIVSRKRLPGYTWQPGPDEVKHADALVEVFCHQPKKRRSINALPFASTTARVGRLM